MALSPKLMLERIQRVMNAWETLTPEKSYGGMTLTEFKAKVQPSLDARESIDQLKAQLSAAYASRVVADDASEEDVLLVVDGVRGDPSEGPNGTLYRAMGYVIRAERRSGLHRKQPQPNNVTPIAA